MTERKPIVAIDGPVGAGKTTTARKAAQVLGFLYIDTGAMYRAVTLDVLNNGVEPEDEENVGRIARESKVEPLLNSLGQRTILNGVDVSDRIRDRDVTNAVSAVSAMRCVRERMWAIQRRVGRNGGVVMEGRDIGTVVFPDAEFKVYLDASVDVRAKRRYDELRAKGVEIALEELKKEILERDRANTERDLAPLKKAPDAVVIDTTGKTFEEQVEAVVSLVRGETKTGKFERKKERIRHLYKFVQVVTYLIYKIFYRLNTTGIENIPETGGCIIASNHAAVLDPPALGCVVPREVSFFAKKELFPVPVVGWFISYTKAIPVDRQGYSAGALKALVKSLKSGRPAIMFPEGTRTRTGEFLKPKTGVGMAAVMTGVPVVPCWIQGSYKAKPFVSKITIHFLPPFRPDKIEATTKKEHYLLVSEQIMCDISKLREKHMAVLNKAKS